MGRHQWSVGLKRLISGADHLKEPFNDDGTWRSDVFYNTLGTSFVSIALEAAHTADPLFDVLFAHMASGPNAAAFIPT